MLKDFRSSCPDGFHKGLTEDVITMDVMIKSAWCLSKRGCAIQKPLSGLSVWQVVPQVWTLRFKDRNDGIVASINVRFRKSDATRFMYTVASECSENWPEISRAPADVFVFDEWALLWATNWPTRTLQYNGGICSTCTDDNRHYSWLWPIYFDDSTNQYIWGLGIDNKSHTCSDNLVILPIRSKSGKGLSHIPICLSLTSI